MAFSCRKKELEICTEFGNEISVEITGFCVWKMQIRTTNCQEAPRNQKSSNNICHI